MVVLGGPWATVDLLSRHLSTLTHFSTLDHVTIASFASNSLILCLCLPVCLACWIRLIVRGRCRVPPPPLPCWQPADLRGWLFGVALCTRTRRPHCVKEKRGEAILVLSPTEALHTKTEAPHGFAWMGKRLLCFSVCELRNQQRISKGMAQRNRKWPNWETRSSAKMEVKPRQKQWMGIGRTQTASSPLCTSCTLSSSVAEEATTTLALCLLRGSHCTTSCCSKMYKYVQRRTRVRVCVHCTQIPPSHCKVVGKPQQELFLKLPCSCSLLSRNNLAPLDKS